MGIRLGKIISNLPHNLVRFWTIQRPRFAVRTEHGHFDCDRRRLSLDSKLQQPIRGFRCGENVSQLNPRINVSQLLPVDGLDDLPLCQLARSRSGRSFLDIGNPHDKRRLHQINPHAHRPKALDGL